MFTTDFLFYVFAGFIAQIIDGAIGMGYGVMASTLLLTFGISPAATSATVHAAECFTTGVSAISHRALGNVDRVLVRGLLLPGVVGAVVGAYILSSVPGETLKPFISVYLLIMGIVILIKTFYNTQPQNITKYLSPLGFIGAFVDALGGGGWGPIVTSNLIVRGNPVTKTIGSVNYVEFFVTFASSLTFLLTLGLVHWEIILGLALGGGIAAPFGAWFVGRIAAKPLTRMTGLGIILLSVRTLAH